MLINATSLAVKRAATGAGGQPFNSGHNGGAFDWISAVSGLASAIVGIITLITVYIGATQFLSQNRMYRHGLSWRSLGHWQKIVDKSGLFGLQSRIAAPTVSLKSLAKQEWEPSISFPIGFPKVKNGTIEDGESFVQAKASWVNFMQALGLGPHQNHLYEMQDAPELLNGIVPMQWAGSDLVSISSILGFQSPEDKPSYKSSMPLPMQWSSPLGWLQFRASANGCVAQFRPRRKPRDQISPSLHSYYDPQDLVLPSKTSVLCSRLWTAINGYVLQENRVLYLGGADKHKRPQDIDDDAEMGNEELLRNIMKEDLPEQELMRQMFGKKEARSTALNQEVERTRSAMAQKTTGSLGRDTTESFLESILNTEKQKIDRKEVLRPCPGLLSTVVEGQLAFSRGLEEPNYTYIEYDRKYAVLEDIDRLQYPFNLGDLYLDGKLLKLVKEAVLQLQPDGFYFSPSFFVASDLREIFENIQAQSNTLKELCNDLQRTRKTARAHFSVPDMQLIAKAASSLRTEFLQPRENTQTLDLVWALIYSRQVVRAVLRALSKAPMARFLETPVFCKNNKLDLVGLLGDALHDEMEEKQNDDEENQIPGHYHIPHLDDGNFTGEDILAALALVFLTYFWIDKSWITDTSHYDATIPHSVLMC
ncbi:uncharacterized protein TRIREDRAFT_76360 [Trichoderma reesei QM6a]|uniref:Predicted protein n=2 Tax=Hypocrea jecorina TaxID=51453 RepID=G0REK6_HYPJQ|nr:uncharacterized protein TRIREDRAFT_76360 [Trichoderma reesei QM6a]EGR50384.1 predicted protein [Trichoderma reesei QM6a]ETS03814.1 hypothetical protein M419DRAFT_108533 [Trichoderma reesei RUT C-30]